jgi:hypothetical protein
MANVTTVVSNLDRQIAEAQQQKREALASLSTGTVAQLQLRKGTSSSNCVLSTASVTELGNQIATAFGLASGNTQFTVSNTSKGPKILGVATYNGDTRLGSQVLCELMDDAEGTIGQMENEGLIFSIDHSFLLTMAVIN